MPKFCSECGAKLPDENMKFCSECGKPLKPSSGSGGSQKPAISSPSPSHVEKKPIEETSRLSGLKLEKYLIPNEIVKYATRGSLYVGGEANLKGYVTNNRVIFYKSTGLIFKDDRLHEIPLKDINQFKIVETGILNKKMYLELNNQLNNLKIAGERSDVLGMYKAIQLFKHGER